MNKILLGFICGFVMFVVASCAEKPLALGGHAKAKLGSSPRAATDLFRINMAYEYDSSYPATPTAPAGGWVDVSDWQAFLKQNAFLSSQYTPSDVFDLTTETATENFQKAQKGGILNQDGVVTQPTYNKATSSSWNMPKYPPVTPGLMSQYAARKRQQGSRVGTGRASTDPFRLNMKYGYDFKSPCWPIAPAGGWVDVWNWQQFLKQKGFLSCKFVNGRTDHYQPSNLFDMTTELATENFQASELGGPQLPRTGVVTKETYDKAKNAGMMNYPPVTGW